MQFTGTIEKFKVLVGALERPGHWRNEGSFYEFVADSGEKLNWWPKTGIITIIGHPGEVKKLSQQLHEILEANS